MSFVNNYSYTIRRSNKEIFYFYCENNLFYRHYDSNKNLICETNILEDYIKDFTLFNFSIDEDDNIYGVLCFDNLKIIKCEKNDSNFIVEDTLKFDFQKFRVCYPYLKKINNTLHIFYYAYEIQENNTTALFHIYKENNLWHEHKIDFIRHIVLNEYKVIFIENIPVIFYFNMIDDAEEIFCSIFDRGNHSWSEPIQITDTKRKKLYLDVAIKENLIHITYCYEIDDNYCLKYINGVIKNNYFKIHTSTDIEKYSAFMYPSFAIEENIIFLMWVHLNKLYTCYSVDDGFSWSKPFLDFDSVSLEFLRSRFLSNYNKDLSYNDSNLFITSEEISFLGF